MKILFLHGWKSVPGGRKPSFLKDHGHLVVNPALPDDDFEEAVRIAQAAVDQHNPDVIVGSSRGGAVAMSLASGDTPLVLLCPAWRKWGSANRVQRGTTILHSRADDVVDFADSVELARASGLPASAPVEVGEDHRLADEQSLLTMLKACEQHSRDALKVDVTVYYLEMLENPGHHVRPPREELTVLHARTPSVPYYRFLYNSVGQPYHWLSRRKLSDDALSIILNDPLDEVHVLHVEGAPAGFAELDRRQPNEVELVQFGLMSEFIGQGLGKWFLQWTIDQAWRYRPERFWLHTCTLDHPAAVPTYTKAGFVQFKEEQILREL